MQWVRASFRTLAFRVPIIFGVLTLTCSAQSSRTPPDFVVSVQKLSLSGKAQREYAKGTRLLMQGHAQASIEHFLRVVDEKPHYYGAYHNLAMAYLQVGQYEAAGANFQRSIDLAGAGYAPSLYGLAMVLYSKQQFAEAETLALRASLLAPSAGGKICLGVIQLALGHLPDAEHSARDAIQMDPTQPEAYFLLATAHDRQNDPEAVVADLHMYSKLAREGSRKDAAQALLARAQQALSSESTSLDSYKFCYLFW